MAKLTDAERAELDRLRAREEEPDEDEGDDDDHDDGVIVLRGARADAFLSGLFGKKGKRKAAEQPPAGDGDEDQGDEGDDEGEPEPEPDRKPRAGHRYFS